VKLNN